MTSGDNPCMVSKQTLPQVNISEHGKLRYLHLRSQWVQGSMDTRKPNAIHLDYVQRMQQTCSSASASPSPATSLNTPLTAQT
jgi:hypothetical protein